MYNVGKVWVLGVFVICLCSVPACAALVSFDIGMIFNGTGMPTNPAPWLNAAFEDVSANTVELTITTINLTGTEKIGEVYFNLDPALNPNQLGFTNPTIVSGQFEIPSISKGYDSCKADGDGLYDFSFTFSGGAALAFNGGDAVKYTLTLAGLTSDSFNFTSAHGGGEGEYITAAHLMALGTSNNSVWATIPEPATMTLLGLGVMGLLKKRRA
jgi:hypothetical protein